LTNLHKGRYEKSPIPNVEIQTHRVSWKDITGSDKGEGELSAKACQKGTAVEEAMLVNPSPIKPDTEPLRTPFDTILQTADVRDTVGSWGQNHTKETRRANAPKV
jgi:hypothetical protein